MSIRRCLLVVPLLVLLPIPAATGSASPPELPATCTPSEPTVSHPTATSTLITVGFTCTGASSLSTLTEVLDAAGGVFASIASTTDVTGAGASKSEVLLPVFVPRACQTVNDQKVCSP